MKTVVIMAGGTGGHVIPALSVAKCLRDSGAKVHWLGTHRGLESRLVPQANIPISYLSVAGVRGKSRVQQLLAPLRMLQATYQAMTILRQLRPHCVLGMGGFVSAPGGIAAWLLRIPVVIHEQNAVPGMANRLLGRLAKKVFAAFPNSFPTRYNAQTVGNPVRSEIANLAPPVERFKDRDGAVRLLVIGGSQGALRLNQLVPKAIALGSEEQRPDIWHQAGPDHLESTKAAYAELNIQARVEAFIDAMAEAYGWADMILCRAGALTIAELTAAGVGSLLVPYPYAVDDHQTQNATFLVQAGAALLLPQKNLNPQTLQQTLMNFSNNRPQLLTMAVSARRLCQSSAAEKIAKNCLELS